MRTIVRKNVHNLDKDIWLEVLTLSASSPGEFLWLINLISQLCAWCILRIYFSFLFLGLFALSFRITRSQIVLISTLGPLKRQLYSSICADSFSFYFLMSFPVNYSDLIPQELMTCLSLHMWSSMPDFVVSPLTTAFWCFSTLTFKVPACFL